MTDTNPNYLNAKFVCKIMLDASDVLFTSPARTGCTIHLPSSGTCWVSGDLHDNPEHLETIVKLAALDSPNNHVVLQELIHSGEETDDHDLSYQTLVRVAELVVSYPKQVHPILANHEISQAMGRAITKGSGDLVSKFIRGVYSVFDNNTGKVLKAINAFIFSMPLAVRSETGLLCTHSLPDENKMDTFDKTVLGREMLVSDIDDTFGSANLLVWGRSHTQQQVEELAANWGVKLICVGHAFVPDGIEVAFSNLLLINSDHKNGVVLPINLEKIDTAEAVMELAVKLNSAPS
jgi:hypothetical protein